MLQAADFFKLDFTIEIAFDIVDITLQSPGKAADIARNAR